MRLYPPIYPQYGMLQAERFSGGIAANVWKTGIFRTSLMRRNIIAESMPETGADVATLLRQAGAPRTWIGSTLKSYYEALARKFAGSGQSDMENYLATSQILTDPEERVQRYQCMYWQHG